MEQPLSKASPKIYVTVSLIIIVIALVVGAYYLSMGLQGPEVSPLPSTSAPTQSPNPTVSASASFNSPTPSIQPSALPMPVVSKARNWAGYVVASDLQNPQPTIVAIGGSWIVPSLTDVGVDAFSAVWIGIGGQFDQTLIQTGTEQDFIGGTATYSAWYELLPDDSITINTIDVSPGDQMEASIKLINPNSNLWSLSIADLTTGQKYQNNFTYHSGQSSADWIIERPDVNGVLSTLADFGNVTFSNCQVSFKDKGGTINEYPSSEVIMDMQLRFSQYLQLVDVSNLNNQGTEFTVSYLY